MKDFKRPSGKGAGRGSFDKREHGGGFPRGDRPGFGNHKGDHNAGERREVKFQATCSECNKTCEVPFRPNGSKPVYCKDCFGSKKGAPYASRSDRPAAAPARAVPPAPVRDTRIDDLKAQMDSMQSKLDRIILALAETKPAPSKAPSKVPAKSAAKKVVAKPVVKKKK